MRALDTNVLVRFVVDDVPAQSSKAERVLADTARSRERLFVSIPALCELVWVLKKTYLQRKVSIVNVIQSLVNDDWFQVENEHEVAAALDSYRRGNVDFSDCLIGHLARKAGCRETVTFDKKASKRAPGFTLL